MRPGQPRLALKIAGLAASLAGGAASAREPTKAELLAQIAELETKVKALEGERDAPQPPAGDGTIQNVLADAERRSRSLRGLAGYDDGFFLKSDDGNFLLRPVILFQFRGVANSSESPDAGRHSESGFEIRRMEFSVEGHALSPELTYEFLVTAERDGGDFILEDAFVAYEVADPWGVALGQFKDPLFREQQSSSKYMLAVDRSLVNELIAAPTEFVQGVALVYGSEKTPVQWALAFHDGAGSINTPFLNAPGAVEADEHFGVTGRLEYKLSGDWENYEDFTAKGTDEALLVLGAAAEWTEADGGNVFFATLDAQYERPGGFGTYGALLARHADFNGTSLDLGALAQAAFLLTPRLEPFGRYGVTVLDEDDDAFHEFTAGFNYYLGGSGPLLHRGKFTLDLTYLLDGAPSDASGIGVLQADGAEFVVRGQFQLLL